MQSYFSIYDAAIPVLIEMPQIILHHPGIPARERNRLAALTRKTARWFETCAAHSKRVEGRPVPTPDTIPFTRQNLKAAFSQLTIAHLDVSEKSVANTLSDLNRIAGLLGMPRDFAFAALSSPCQALHDLLVTHEDRGSCIRLLRVLSAHNIHPEQVAGAVLLLRQQIDADWKVKDKSREFKRALYAWNHAVKTVPGWPQIVIDVPKVRTIWGQRWRDGLSALEASVDEHLSLGEPKPDGADLFAGPAIRPLRPATKRGRKEAARMVVSALRDAGIDVASLKHVRNVCLPDRFKTAFRVLADRAGGVTATVMRYAIDVRKLARLPNVLTSEDLAAFEEAYAKLRVRHQEYLTAQSEAGQAVDRGQVLLDRLDDDAAMDAYMSLAHREAEAVRRSRTPYTVGNAYKIERALTLEVWHTVSWRIGVSVAWRLDQFVEVVVNGEKRIMVRAPKDQAANKNTPDQYLSPEAAVLLQLFQDKYRDIILRHNKGVVSPYLFPGRGGGQRHPHTMRQQMNRWIRKETNLDFHPHAVRKINPKVILDADPTAMELAIRSGGWADDRMLRKIYGQKNHRQSQHKINEFVQQRRLRGISTLRKPNKRASGKKPPKTA